MVASFYRKKYLLNGMFLALTRNSANTADL
jgi:hypothetical protein